MNFSLTFTDLKSNGSFYGFGNFIKYLPVRGKGNYTFDIYSKFLSSFSIHKIRKCFLKFNQQILQQTF